MNGIHDMGGMEGFGPIRPESEAEEPVFHAEWEGRVYGMNRALGSLRQWNIDIGRHARERLNPVVYLRNSYYENWLAGIETLLLESGLVTDEELWTGKASSPVSDEIKARILTVERASVVPPRLTNNMRELEAPPRFQAGDRVHAINRHPHGHTREPRYVRGHVGTVHEYYGGQVFPDSRAEGVDEGGHLYCVRFEGSELWGESANARSAVYVDLWENYLEHGT
jgi:nitrile hydratase beta subunit